MSRIAAVVFDWAGTMVDFGCLAPARALQAAFAARGVPLTEAEARADMGRAKRDHVAALLARPAVRERWLAAWGATPAEPDIEAVMADLEPIMARLATERSELVPGAADVARELARAGVRVGSCTGYTPAMMRQVVPRAAAQGYRPEALVCAGDTAQGRPSPLMLWKVMTDLRAWPAHACVKVDDAAVGIAEGISAGTWTVGVTASGNGMGLDLPAFDALPGEERRARLAVAAAPLIEAGADFTIETVADLPRVIEEIERRLKRGERPGLGGAAARQA
jgi:phosphonoacetaldehyde hydrolase